MIFRKVADVRRERELAERRKNEPQLDHNQDHLVRKIFSKFRRGTAGGSTAGSNHAALPPSSGTPVATPDVERGGASDSESACSTRLGTAADEATSAPITTLATTPQSAPQTTSRAVTRWGRLLGSASSGAEASDKEARGTASISVKERPAPQPPSGSGNKVFPKQVTPQRSNRQQDTIEEIVEVEERRVARTALLRKAESNDSGILRSSEQRLNEPAPVSTPTPTPTPVTPTIAPLPAPELQQVLASIAEFKVDIRLELQRLGQRAARLEDMLCAVSERLGPGSSTATTPAPSEEDAPRSARSQRGGDSSSTAPSSAAPSATVRKRRSKSRSSKPPAPAPATPASDEPASASARSDEDEGRPSTARSRTREYL